MRQNLPRVGLIWIRGTFFGTHGMSQSVDLIIKYGLIMITVTFNIIYKLYFDIELTSMANCRRLKSVKKEVVSVGVGNNNGAFSFTILLMS